MSPKDYHEEIKQLKSKGTYKEALKVAREGLLKYKENNMLKCDYGWCLYYIYLKNKPKNQEEIMDFKKALNYIVKTNQVTNKFSPLKRSLLKVIEYSEVIALEEEELLGYYEQLGKEDLSTEEIVIEIQGKPVKQMSEKEVWYMRYSKALYKVKKHKEALDLCNQALEENMKFHRENKQWLIKRKADCLIHIENYEVAIKLLEGIKNQLNHWSVELSLATAYQHKNKVDQASKCFAKAALLEGISKRKVGLYKQYAEHIKIKNPDMAYAHFQLIKFLYIQENWYLKADFLEDMKKFKVQGYVEEKDIKILEKKLEQYWQEQSV